MGFTPAGAEELFDWIAKHGMPKEEHLAMLRDEYDTEFLGPNPFVT